MPARVDLEFRGCLWTVPSMLITSFLPRSIDSALEDVRLHPHLRLATCA